jgi:hypothetical protein
MSILSFLLGEKKKTATVAKERLQIILAHERTASGAPADSAARCSSACAIQPAVRPAANRPKPEPSGSPSTRRVATSAKSTDGPSPVSPATASITVCSRLRTAPVFGNCARIAPARGSALRYSGWPKPGNASPRSSRRRSAVATERSPSSSLSNASTRAVVPPWRPPVSAASPALTTAPRLAPVDATTRAAKLEALSS